MYDEQMWVACWLAASTPPNDDGLAYERYVQTENDQALGGLA